MAKTFNKLTRPIMRKLAANTSVSEHGITFKREGSGDGLFSVNVMVDGRRIHRVVGRESDGTTRTQAEDYIAKLRTDARHDRLNLPKGRKISLTFREAVPAYLARLSTEGGKDLKMKASRFRLHLVPYFSERPISKITSSDVDQYKQLRLQECSLRGGDRVSAKAKLNGAAPRDNACKSAPGTINRELAALSHLLNKAVEWGWLDRRGPKIARLPEGKGRITYLTVEQTKRLVECAKASDSRHLYPYVVVALETSMRTMEILSIRKENINLEQRLIRTKCKGRPPRTTDHGISGRVSSQTHGWNSASTAMALPFPFVTIGACRRHPRAIYQGCHRCWTRPARSAAPYAKAHNDQSPGPSRRRPVHHKKDQRA